MTLPRMSEPLLANAAADSRGLPAARFVVFERIVVGDYRARSHVNAETEHVRSVIVTDGVEHPSSGVDGR